MINPKFESEFKALCDKYEVEAVMVQATPVPGKDGQYKIHTAGTMDLCNMVDSALALHLDLSNMVISSNV